MWYIFLLSTTWKILFYMLSVWNCGLLFGCDVNSLNQSVYALCVFPFWFPMLTLYALRDSSVMLNQDVDAAF